MDHIAPAQAAHLAVLHEHTAIFVWRSADTSSDTDGGTSRECGSTSPSNNSSPASDVGGCKRSSLCSPYNNLTCVRCARSIMKLSMLAYGKRRLRTPGSKRPQYRSIGKAHVVQTGPIAAMLSAMCSNACMVNGHVEMRLGSCR